LYTLDPLASAGLTWVRHSETVTGKAPQPRNGHGFAALGGKLYMFGGIGENNSQGDSSAAVTLVWHKTAHALMRDLRVPRRIPSCLSSLFRKLLCVARLNFTLKLGAGPSG
jgi:hypothetical protein